MGLRMNRDTERMVLSDMIYSSAEPAGWVLLPNRFNTHQVKPVGINDFQVLFRAVAFF